MAMNNDGTVIDRSGTVTLGGTSQSLMAANANRAYLLIMNPTNATEDLFICLVGAAETGSVRSFSLSPGGTYERASPSYVPSNAITITAATTAHAFVACEG
jgi:hypothetical protein